MASRRSRWFVQWLFLLVIVRSGACLPAWEDRWWVEGSDDDDGGGGGTQWIATRICISHPSSAGSAWSGICSTECAGDQDCPEFQLDAGGVACGSCGWSHTLPTESSETVLACDVAGIIDADELAHPCNSGYDCAGISQPSGATAGCY